MKSVCGGNAELGPKLSTLSLLLVNAILFILLQQI